MTDMAADRERVEEVHILERIFRPTMGKVLSDHLNVPVFFLTLDPTLWALRYFAETSSPDTGNVALLDSLSDHLDVTRRSWDVKELDELIRSCARRQPSELPSAAQLLDAAAHQLSSYQLPLGWTSGTDADDEQGSGTLNWRLEKRGATALRWFQHALDFAVHDFDQNKLPPDVAAKLRRPDYDKVIEVLSYMEEPGLIDQRSFRFYLAEYLYSQRGIIPKSVTNSTTPSLLEHYFLPLSGLGQWRAAACWVAGAHTRQPRIEKGLHASIQVLFSQALIDAFGTGLDLALAQGAAAKSRREQIHGTFSLLWWSHEIAFFTDNTVVARTRRNDAGELTPTAELRTSLVPWPASRFLSVLEQDGTSIIQLDLSKLAKVERRVIREVLGCDRILFALRLFDKRAKGMVETVYGERIGERLSLAVRTYDFQKRVTEAATQGSVGHLMKSTVNITGWHKALHGLQEMPEPRATPVTEAIRSLSLYSLVESTGGLLRLVGLCSEGDYAKIGRWTSREAVNRWRQAGPAELDRYAWFIRRFVTMICCGLGWNHGFTMIVDTEHGDENLMEVATLEPPRGSIEDWIAEKGALPPLSASEGPDSHFALLYALIEPVCNAVKTIKALDRTGRPGRLYLRITARFPRCITVAIGNDVIELPRAMAPGLIQAKNLLELTFVATIRESKALCHPGTGGELDQYWVEVDLHAIDLARKILDLPEGDDET